MISSRFTHQDNDIIISVNDCPESKTIFTKRGKAMRVSSLFLIVFFVMIYLCSVGFAIQVPHLINYQGKLTKAGTCSLDTTITMVFKIYADSTTSSYLWTESQNSVKVEEGIFSVLLGSVNPIPDSVFNGNMRYLGVKAGGDNEMVPRKSLVSVGYAFHATTADSAYNIVSGGGINSIDGVSNSGGDVDLIPQNSINITPNDGNNTITIGESHSARTDNPHSTTAAQTGALVSTDGVSNPGGDVDFIQQNAITITPNDPANTITIGETHSARTDNPHQTTAAQTGAPVSVDGVSNPGGDVDLIAGTNITITSDDVNNNITIASTAGTTRYARVWTVAQSGGDFTTISQALDSCVNPGPNNGYLIRVMPGVYNEAVVCSTFTTLQGAGKYVCYINGPVTGADSSIIEDFYIRGGIYCNGTSPTIIHNIITNIVDANGIDLTNGARPWIKENEIISVTGYGINCNGWGTDPWIIANKINHNYGGIYCFCSSPTISNNEILENTNYGIYLLGMMGQPTEPTIDDNVIGLNGPSANGIGIYMEGYAEPRIIANDIYINYTGIEIHPETQPSILANEINYNRGYGIRCFSSGASRPVTIKSNHIHSNYLTGVEIQNSSPIVSHNNINNHQVGIDMMNANPLITYNSLSQNVTWDIQYVGPIFPMISWNMFNSRNGVGATGLYNLTSVGLVINP